MMMLYHVSDMYKPDTLYKEFIPRVPSASLNINDISKENTTIKRVCFSTSVNGCFSAMGENKQDIFSCGTFTLFELDSNEFPNQSFIFNDEIIKRKLVYDASVTGETWYVGESNLLLKAKYCKITSSQAEYLFNWGIISKDDIIPFINKYAKIDFDISAINSSEELFRTIERRLDSDKQYDACDALYDDITDHFSFAQYIKYDIKYKVYSP